MPFKLYLCVFPERPIHHYVPLPIPDFPAWNGAPVVTHWGADAVVDNGQRQPGIVPQVG